jgi:transposase-like protein
MKKHEKARNGPNNAVLSPKQEAVALCLASGRTQEDAARETGVGTRTIKTWITNCPLFNRRVGELRSEMTSRAVGRLVESMTSAAETLDFLCRQASSEQVRLGSARALLELGCKIRETVEIEQRISRLEEDQDRRATQ